MMENTEIAQRQLKEKIIAENIHVHDEEAIDYEVVHGEIFNWFEQRRIKNDLNYIFGGAKDLTALDIGCGTGNLTIKMMLRGAHVTAIDLSPKMIEVLNQKISRVKLSNYPKIINIPIDEFLDENGERFDIVAISSVLHHLPDYCATLQKIIKRINPSGFLYVTHEPSGLPPKPRRGRGLLYLLDFKLFQIGARNAGSKAQRRDYSYSDYHYYHGFNSKKIIEIIQGEGLKIKKAKYYSCKMKYGVSSVIDNLVYLAKENFSVIAKKE